MSHSTPAQHPERRELARSRRRSPRPGGGRRRRRARAPTPTARRVVADRQVLVAARAGGRAISSTLALPSDQVVWQCRSPRISATSTSARRLAAERRLAQLRRAPRRRRAPRTRAPRRARPAAARARRRTPASPSRARAPCRTPRARRRTSSTGTPSTVTPTARRSPRSTTATICGSARSARAAARDRAAATTTASCSQASRQRRASPGELAVERLGDPADQRAGPVQQQRRGVRRLRLLRERGESFASVSGPMPGTSRSRPRRAASRSSSAVRCPGRGAISSARFGAEPEQPAEPDELGRQFALQLGELGDLARLDQLAQPRLDPGPDPAQLAHPAGADELPATGARRADQSPPPAGRPARCRGSRPRARAARRTPRGARDRRVVEPCGPGSQCAARSRDGRSRREPNRRRCGAECSDEGSLDPKEAR